MLYLYACVLAPRGVPPVHQMAAKLLHLFCDLSCPISVALTPTFSFVLSVFLFGARAKNLQKKNNLCYCRVMATEAPTTVDPRQAGLLDISGQEYDINWVDEKQPLFIPNRPLHYKAHRLQVLLDRLDKQAQNKATAFNSANYLAVLNEYIKCIETIRGERPEDEPSNNNSTVDETALAAGGDEGEAPEVGHGITPSMGARISSDNPFAGQGPNSL